MKPRDEISADVRELINACVDDRLDEAGRARLQQLIVADANVRRAYVQMMSMLGGVHRFLQERPSLVADIEESNHDTLSGAPSAMPLVLDVLPQNDSSDGGNWLGAVRAVQGFLLVLLIATGIGVWWLSSGRNEGPKLAENRNQPIELPLEVRSVRLDSGTARLTLPKVGYVIVEGPAEFNLLGPKRARLNKGRIKMRVTEESGRGFVVETPDGEVTDLGTEFGLDVTNGRETGLVVFEGSVNLRVAETRATEPARIEQFSGGEGAVFNKEGRLDRIVSVVTGDLATFNLPSETDQNQGKRVIVNVADNFRTADTKKFYEIVPEGLREDALAYVDREHQWNGITSDGMPTYLLNADYVKTFNSDNTKVNRKIFLTLARPARLFVFLDVRAEPPEWLTKSFRNTGDKIGLDAAPNKMKEFKGRKINIGPGNAVDEQLVVWERVVEEPGVVMLGSNGTTSTPWGPAMYGIAAAWSMRRSKRRGDGLSEFVCGMKRVEAAGLGRPETLIMADCRTVRKEMSYFSPLDFVAPGWSSGSASRLSMNGAPPSQVRLMTRSFLGPAICWVIPEVAGLEYFFGACQRLLVSLRGWQATIST